jgi:Holliday junction resolvase RusA-like endonuclease
MSEKVCAVCGKALSHKEIRINEIGRQSVIKKKRYLCAECRRRDYDEYMKAMKDLIKKF